MTCQEEVAKPEIELPINGSLTETNLTDLGTSSTLNEFRENLPIKTDSSLESETFSDPTTNELTIEEQAVNESDEEVLNRGEIVSPEIRESSSVMAPMALGTQETPGNSGNISSGYGTYSWSAIASSDGKYVDWTLSVSQVSMANTSRFQVIEIKIPTVFSAITTANIISSNGINSGDMYFSADGRTATFWSSYYGPNAASISITIRTNVVNGPNTTLENFTLPFTPAIHNYSQSPRTLYGISNSAAAAVWTRPLPKALTGTTISVKNPGYAPYVTYTVTKTGAGGTALAGASFTLKQGTTTIGPITTGSDGKAVFNNVTAGTYTLTETVVPEGYDGKPPQVVEISSTNTGISIANTLKPVEIKIVSQDQSDFPIQGAVYRLYNITTKSYVGNTYTTLADGSVTITGLTKGNNYRIEQVSVPTEYTAGTVTSQEILDLQYGTTPITFNNIKNSYSTVNINLKKTNTTTNLQGGVFEIWSTGTNPQRMYGPVTTVDNGNASFSNVLNGVKYEVRQITTPTNYLVV